VNDDADDSISPTSSAHGSTRGPRRGLEWSLRSMHKIDTSAQHFLSNYYADEPASETKVKDTIQEDQTAYEIFKSEDRIGKDSNGKSGDSVWASLHAPLRTGIVDGKKVVFELRTNVNQKPKISREERMKRKREIINSNRSGLEVRVRFWLMHFTVEALSASFLAAFVAMNVIYAGFFYSLEDTCCDDPNLSFGEVFAFCVQTSATIGYGSMSPSGKWANFFVLMLSYGSILMNTLFAGLLFTKFVTPVINIQFSDVMTICNVNGVPCLSVRIGNADGLENPLTDVNVRLTYAYQIPYTDHKGELKYFRQTEELQLLSSRQHGLVEEWTLRHVLDESSPLFGLNFEEHPANKIYVFTLSIDAVQEITKSTVNVQSEYGIEDILIGYSFLNVVTMSEDGRCAISDYSKLSETEPYPVWYPAKAGAYDTGDLISS
jgi:inward rectifier potassium channel